MQPGLKHSPFSEKSAKLDNFIGEGTYFGCGSYRCECASLSPFGNLKGKPREDR